MGKGSQRTWRSPLAGRVAERRTLAAVLRDAAEGRPSAVLVHGEAGIGKTRLVAEVCRHAEQREGMGVLWGSCVRFGAASAPYAPLAMALRDWLAVAGEAERSRVLAGADELAQVLPELRSVASSRGAGSTAGSLLQTVDAVVAQMSAHRPTALVVDDLQWADVSSLDVLAYLVTGFREQQLAVLCTYRDGELHEGHPLRSWVADLTRLPGVSRLRLQPLDLPETAEQVGGLLTHADDELAAQVLARSRGNPYLSELLVGDLPSDAVELVGVPDLLRDALLAAWHRLSAEAREVTRVLAVSGRAAPSWVLAEVVPVRGIESTCLPAALREAVEAGVVVDQGEGGFWFRHPLLAEVVYDTLLSGERSRVHATYAAVVEASEDWPQGLYRSVDLATHHERAGHDDDALWWSLTAADTARDLGAFAEESQHLTTAADLWPRAADEVRRTAGDRGALLLRTARAAFQAGDLDATLARVDQALALIPPGEREIEASVLHRWRCQLLHRAGREYAPLGPAEKAVSLTASFPDAPERAGALTTLAWAASRHGLDAEAGRHIRQAHALATRLRSDGVLAEVLAKRSTLRSGTTEALRDAERAYRLAARCRDAETLGDAAVFWLNALDALGRVSEAVAVGQQGCAWLARHGGYDHQRAFLSSRTAHLLLCLGRWEECGALLREALATRPRGNAGSMARLTAARLAVRRGRVEEAAAHLHRAEELVPAHEEYLVQPFPPVQAEVAIAQGDPRLALEVIRGRVVTMADSDRGWVSELLVWGAQAAADLAQHGHDRADRNTVDQAVAAVDELLALQGQAPRDPFAPDAATDEVTPALGAAFAAECARCRGEPQAALREASVLAWRRAGFRFDEAVASWRWSQALLAEGGPRHEAAAALRASYAVATELAAEPLRAEVVALADLARIPLEEPREPQDAEDTARPLAVLTPRERQVLAHLTAGRTYGEIARDLFISEKTVSVHVSHILAKTGTANRLEAAALARRLGFGPG